jgi:hypothetical protein
MTVQKPFDEQLAELQQEVLLLDDSHGEDLVEGTASRLEGLNFGPPVITDIGTFLRMRRQDLLLEIDRIVTLPEDVVCSLAPGDTRKCQDLRLQYITVLIFYYKKLLALRQGDSNEWDEIDELYVHD